MKFKTIDQAGDLKGKRVLFRIDLNVAIKNGRVADDYRLKKMFPTLHFLQEAGAKIIMFGHLESVETKNVEPIYNYLKNYFSLTYIPEVVGEKVTEAVSQLSNGEIVLLENVRTNPGEKANDALFAAELARLGDIYVNEAFSAAHRAHATIIGIPKLLPAYAGFLFKDEVENLSRSLHPERPFVFILGGAKFDTKLPLVTKFLSIADSVYVAGALANDCYKERGLDIGQSLSSDTDVDLKQIIQNQKVKMPVDVVVKNGDAVTIKKPAEVSGEDRMWDAGPESIKELGSLIAGSKFILWNGPLGNYELGFKEGTLELAKIIAESGAHSVVGGGDTLAAIAELKLEDKFTFVSTAGGAMLDFLANETLPGIQALEK